MNWEWEKSQFDTEILGFNTAKISHIASGNSRKILIKNIVDLTKELEKHKIEYATYRVPADNYSMIQSLEENGFLMVDGYIALEAKLSAEEYQKFPQVKEANQRDFNQLVSISKSVFRGVTRYYHDPVIPEETADRVYEEWIKNSLNKKVADMVLVWKENRSCLGFITLQKKGHIPLVGVSAKSRGKGIGKGLLLATLETMKGWGNEKVFIETQMTNIPALRLYQTCGFKVVGSYFTFRLSLV